MEEYRTSKEYKEALTEFAGMLCEDSADCCKAFVLEHEIKWPGFKEDADKVTANYFDLGSKIQDATPPEKISKWPAAIRDCVSYVTLTVVICVIAWLIYNYNIAALAVKH